MLQTGQQYRNMIYFATCDAHLDTVSSLVFPASLIILLFTLKNNPASPIIPRAGSMNERTNALQMFFEFLDDFGTFIVVSCRFHCSLRIVKNLF